MLDLPHIISGFHGSHIDWKTWKIGKHFPVRERSGNFEQTGKVMDISQSGDVETLGFCHLFASQFCTTKMKIELCKIDLTKNRNDLKPDRVHMCRHTADGSIICNLRINQH